MDRRIFLKTTAGTFCLGTASPLLGTLATSFATETAGQKPMLLGTDYYPDQTASSLWEEDARMMAEFGITNVRIAEFAWGLMESTEGHYDFGWLHKSVDILRTHKIAVILGTPSAAPPPWLTQKYPEVLLVNEQGMTMGPEGRRFTCPSNKTYRRLALGIATEMAKNFASKDGVIGWQIDNEYTLSQFARCYCKYCREGFQEWLRAKYATPENLNKTWGTAFWSQTYNDFAQVPVPLPSGGPPNPGMALDYDRYQSYANVSSLEEQLVVLRKMCPAHFVTTNNVPMMVDTINARDFYAHLDFVASDNYPGFFSIFAGEPGSSLSPEAAAPTSSLIHDASRSTKDGKPFLIMEEQVGKAGQNIFAPQPEKGQIRLWSYQAVAHGAMGINYFRWDTATSGAEEYWHGILNHDRSKSPGFDEISQTIRELKALGPELLNSSYLAQAALCFDYSADWAVSIQPGQPKLKYTTEISTWYGTLWAGHVALDIVDATKDLARYKVLFAPLMYVVSEEQSRSIREFVRNGGVFVTGFRLGAKDSASQIVKTPLPGLLRDVMGTGVKDYVPLYSEKQGVKFASMLPGPDAECQIWADVLKPEGAEVLASYTMGEHAGEPAITANTFGRGRAVYVGARLDPASLGRVLNTLAATAGIKPEVAAPTAVEVTARASGGKRWVFVLNHSAKAQSVTLGGPYKDLITDGGLSGVITVEPNGVRVLQPT